MDEISICRELLSHVEALARAHGAAAARRIVIGLGPLSEIEPRRLLQAFSLLCRRTPAEHARLDVEALPLRTRCGECGIELGGPGGGQLCPHCGQSRSVLMNGEDLKLKLVELDNYPRGSRRDMEVLSPENPSRW
jgi:hydrogenase nickel insertion protein HypA